jgi:amino acid transporter
MADAYRAPAPVVPPPHNAGAAAEVTHAVSALPRRLGFWTAIAVVVGDVIGSGIFRVPSTVATEVGSIGGIALVWVVGGVITLCGALAYAELSAALPRPGGTFVYLHEAYGPGVAFLFGWTVLIIEPAAAAALAIVFAEYLGRLVSLTAVGVRLVATAAILVVAAASYRSVRGAGAIQNAATAAKLAALVALIIAAFLLGDNQAGAFGPDAAAADAAGIRWRGMGIALAAALWAYHGWFDVTPLAGEVQNPGRNLPRALLLGTVAVLIMYLAVTGAYLFVLPLGVLRASPLVAADMAVRVLGATGAGAVAAMVMVSAFGALNGTILSMPRVFYAMASEGLLFRPLARVHPRFGTPHFAITGYTALALLLVWFRSFEQLVEAVVLGVWPFLALAVAGVIVLRRTRPDLVRPYRTPLYPFVPVVFVLAAVTLIAGALLEHPVTTLAGIGVTLLGVPIYLVWRARGRRLATPHAVLTERER